MTLFANRLRLIARGSGSPHEITRHAEAGGHGSPKLYLAINLVHLLATMGAVIETARELGGWLHLFQG